jgi:hypothetical protein
MPWDSAHGRDDDGFQYRMFGLDVVIFTVDARKKPVRQRIDEQIQADQDRLAR